MASLKEADQLVYLILDKEELRVLKAALVEVHDVWSALITEDVDQKFVNDTCLLGDICQALGIEGFEFT